MKKNKTPSLIKTNPYLQDPAVRDAWLTRSVISSSAIEGVRVAACRALGVAGQAKQAKVGCVVQCPLDHADKDRGPSRRFHCQIHRPSPSDISETRHLYCCRVKGNL
jgi:hypothetical protein